MKRRVKRRGAYTRPYRTVHTHFLARKWQDWRELSWRKKVATLLLPTVVILLAIPLVTYLFLARDISDPERLMNRANTGVQIMDKNGEVFFSTDYSASLKRLKLAEISDWTEKALVSSEDKNFYTHAGVSVSGLMRALYSNIFAKDSSSGGSTLTQQLAKNTLLSNDRTILRKYQEVVIALAIERTYDKDEILDMYLNSVYYGEGAFGIDEAAHTYFGKEAKDLDLAESAMIVGILPAPTVYSPISGDADKAKTRQKYVLERMQEDGKITKAEKDAALAEVVTYAPQTTEEKTVAPHFVEMVLSQLYDKYGEEKVKRSGYKVKTTLDLTWQKSAEQIVTDQTAINAAGGGTNAALVAIDPKTGGVRALVGSVDYDNDVFGKVNMATTARQPGSSFKPIYVTEAINEKLVTSATIIKDEKTDFGGYAPENYDHRWRGNILLRNALAQSLNVPMVKVMEKLGTDKAIEKAREMGLTTIDQNKNYGLSLALGSAEVTPLAMTSAYSALANAGRQSEVTLIDTISNKYNEQIFKSSVKSKRVQTIEASFIISDILSDNTARAPTFGTSLNISGRTVAVKTGSTDNNHDAWTIGYTPSIAIGVWVGNNENIAMTAGGSGMAGPIWRKAMISFLGDSKKETFVQPSGVIKTSACTVTNGSYDEYFMSGSQPKDGCSQEETSTPIVEQQPSQDSDGDGVVDTADQCANTPSGTTVDSTGCPRVTTTVQDSDSDGVADTADQCANTPSGTTVDSTGCPQTTTTADSDSDGVADTVDVCPSTPSGATVDSRGCAATQTPVTTTQ